MSARVERLKEWLWRQSDHERPPAAFFDELAEALIAEGFPLWRMSSTLISHDPSLVSTRVIWTRGAATRLEPSPHDILDTPDYVGSPAQAVLETGAEVRCRLEEAAAGLSPLLAGLRQAGATDYLAVPVPIRDGLSYANIRFEGRSWLSVATDRPGGFEDRDLEEIRALVPAISLRIALETSKQTARALLCAYLGRNAAARVLGGQFRRGSAELIRAAIWFCDMKGFTGLSDSRAPTEVVRLLDRYFDAVATPVEAHGGEILKFIGDGILAIFPFGREEAAPVCGRALAATRGAIERLDLVSREIRAAGGPALGMGAALHVGEVAYGNIGASSRLDFTAIGAPVNEVCRVEALTRALGVPALLTSAFVAAAGIRARSLGRHALKGVSEPQEVFALPDG